MRLLLLDLIFEAYNSARIASWQKQNRRYIVGGGLFNWIPNISSVTRATGAIEKFISANKDTIKKAIDVTAEVAKAGATTASAIN